MKKAVAWSVTLFLNLIIVLAAVPGAAGQSPSGGERIFPTEFVVRGEFLHFFDRNGGIEVFGYPLTIQFEEDGHLVQYFHRGRMEQLLEGPSGQRVVLGRLGEALMTPEAPVKDPGERPDRRFFPETGHIVASAFLRYFEARGGVDLFGYPITEMMVENGRIVQYFQRARLDWHPENPPPLRIQPGNLGEFYKDQFSLPSWVFVPSNDESIGVELPPVESLDLTPSVSDPFAAPNRPQTLYVLIHDQAGTPLEGAEARAVIHFPDGDREIALTKANDMGLAWQTFDVGQVQMGETVAVEIFVSYGGVKGSTQTSFLVWL
jgi:hypothetical protein